MSHNKECTMQKSPTHLTVLSLGAGVQSSTLALMAMHGAIKAPDVAIFADTGAEPQAVYHWLRQLETLVSFPICHVAKDRGLTTHIEESVQGQRFAGAPFFTESPHHTTTAGQLRRQCTREFKITPINQKIRELLGMKKGQRVPKGTCVTQYIGISLDEVARMKPAREKWIKTEWPLVDLRMTRHDCLNWLKRHGYPEPPRSACVYCPYRSNAEWRKLKDTDPDGWNEALHIDTLIRDGVRGTTHKLYLHRSLIPLEQVDLSTEAERGQLALWDTECTGLCGV